MPAPVALFAYNRQTHLQYTVEALKNNLLAADTDVFIFSDAAKKPEVESEIGLVRNYLKSITGFKSVTIVERDKNWGLANSIIDGVTRLCQEFGHVIVLEDDIVTSPYFLKYMNDALDLYEHEEQVISVHGYMYPVLEKMPETFFLRGADCWGWATWERGWKLFEPDGAKLLCEIKARNISREFNYDGKYDLTGMLLSQVQGRIDSWAVRWYASAFLKNRLTLYPGKSLVLNIGNDSSGTHCGTTEVFSGNVVDRPLIVGGVAIEESLEGRSAVASYFHANRNSLVQRVKNRIERLWRQWGK